MVDLTQTAAFETLVGLTRQWSDIKDPERATAVSDLPWKSGIMDEPGDLMYEPLESIPDNVQDAVKQFVEFCATAIGEGDPDRMWKPPEDPVVAAFMSVILTTPLYGWAIFH